MLLSTKHQNLENPKQILNIVAIKPSQIRENTQPFLNIKN
jgi:hypothetical protein